MYISKSMQAVLHVLANHTDLLTLREISEKAHIHFDEADVAVDRLVRGGILHDEFPTVANASILYQFARTPKAQRHRNRYNDAGVACGGPVT